MRFSCPGKVFIAGEYACIEGGSSLVGTVSPEFSLEIIRDSSTTHRHSFASQSPAGLYLSKHLNALSEVRLQWSDPYSTPIGVGSSSAQFILSLAAVATLEDQPLPTAAEVLKQYWQTVGATQGLRPSGVDVVAQFTGGPTIVRNEPFSARKISPWAGDGIFILAYTGAKAKTHEHLMSLQERGFPKSFASCLREIERLTLQAIEAWQESRAKILGSVMTAYQNELTKAGLASAEFTTRLADIQSWTGVLGCKGTGAQGGDCVLLLVDPQYKSAISTKLNSLGWLPLDPAWTTTGLI